MCSYFMLPVFQVDVKNTKLIFSTDNHNELLAGVNLRSEIETVNAPKVMIHPMILIISFCVYRGSVHWTPTQKTAAATHRGACKGQCFL